MRTSRKSFRVAAAAAVVISAAVSATSSEAVTKTTTSAKCDPGQGKTLAANGFITVYSATVKHRKSYYACRVGRSRGPAFASEIFSIGPLTDVKVAGYYMAYSEAACPKSDDPHCSGQTVVRNVRSGKLVLNSRYGNAPSQDDALVLTTGGAAAWIRSSGGTNGKAVYSVVRSARNGRVSALDTGPMIVPELALSTLGGGDFGITPSTETPTLMWKNAGALRSAPLKPLG